MILIWAFLLVASILGLVKSAEFAIKNASELARKIGVSEFAVSFFIVSILSCFPEATVSVISAIENKPEFGLGTLLGSNVADLTLVFGLVAIFSKKGIEVKNKLIRSEFLLIIMLFAPVILGVDGHLSRLDGILLISCGAIFFLITTINTKLTNRVREKIEAREVIKKLTFLGVAIAGLIISGHYTLEFAVEIAKELQIPSFLIALTVVSIGTCMPELIFSIKAVRENHQSLALGDILGTVIIDATVIIGILALLSPFEFNPKIATITGGSMLISGMILMIAMNKEKGISKNMGIVLLIIYGISIGLVILFNLPS